jgi:hypothetical protein
VSGEDWIWFAMLALQSAALVWSAYQMMLASRALAEATTIIRAQSQMIFDLHESLARAQGRA